MGGQPSLTNSTVARMGALDEPWADRHSRRLRTKLNRRLPDGESLREVAIVFTGPAPNLEGLAEDFLGRGLLRRKYFTIALTDRRLLLISNIGEHSPDKIVHEYRDVTAIEGLNTIDGDTWISVGGKLLVLAALVETGHGNRERQHRKQSRVARGAGGHPYRTAGMGGSDEPLRDSGPLQIPSVRQVPIGRRHPHRHSLDATTRPNLPALNPDESVTVVGKDSDVAASGSYVEPW